jgi:hypothetical protein
MQDWNKAVPILFNTDLQKPNNKIKKGGREGKNEGERNFYMDKKITLDIHLYI